ncbi:hypothetical protein SAMN05443549_101815 [Flavobacterium fluvii]|uniref:Uncharacterized protein n=1 Tax=Flavobacterium fluvii TaxID=468056 RepID=A0A1M5FJF7_9FLAO|nr:hypothetical protein SAMN05443549_101815 [Flavobacterium fluvii]
MKKELLIDKYRQRHIRQEGRYDKIEGVYRYSLQKILQLE